MDLKSAHLYIAFCEGVLDCVHFVNNVNLMKYTVDCFLINIVLFINLEKETSKHCVCMK